MGDPQNLQADTFRKGNQKKIGAPRPQKNAPVGNRALLIKKAVEPVRPGQDGQTSHEEICDEVLAVCFKVSEKN